MPDEHALSIPLREHFERIIMEHEKRDNDKFDAISKATQLALAAQDAKSDAQRWVVGLGFTAVGLIVSVLFLMLALKK